MTNNLDTSAGDRARSRAYHRDFWPGMIGFLGIAGLPMKMAGWVIYAAGMSAWLVTSLVVRKR